MRLAPQPDPVWEMLLSLHALGGSPDHIVFGPWRAETLTGPDPSISLLLQLAPPRGYSPDFLTPAAGADLESALEAVMSVDRARLRAELALLAAQRGQTPWLRRMAEGDAAAMRELGAAMFRYHQRVLSRSWHRIRAVVEAERTMRVRDFLDGGVERLLGTIHPLVRWDPPVLKVDYPVRQDLVLNGRGLLLIPSYFCWGRPVTLLDDGLDPVLVYPANRGLQLLTEDSAVPGPVALARLLGRTRAAVLEEVTASGGTTGGGIARRLGVSAASASEHAAVLREAGLILSRRVANTVWHTATPLGRALAEGSRPAEGLHISGGVLPQPQPAARPTTPRVDASAV
ncbi:ArsR family transcriptional regulator [Streptomyces sp. NPDC052687]|uniref:ArsR family transcriptional regulator n=1 Tax=Streptomyces sp. NPDC052687 TaxID=3154759 RepID=UPI00341FAA1B